VKQVSIYISALQMLTLLFLSNCHDVRRDKSIIVPEEYRELGGKSSIGTEDDPIARFNYEIQLQADLITGEIPVGIYQREINFTRKIPIRKTSSSNLRTRQELWKNIGPTNVGGRTRAFGVDVTHSLILVAGSVSGSMWRSENGGNTWDKTSGPNQLVGASVLVQDMRLGMENIWYYGTGEIRGNTARDIGAPYRGDGIFKSIDGARTWFQLPSTAVSIKNIFNSQFNYVHDMVLNHTRTDVDEIYAAVYGGILRSQDGGISWNAVLGDELFNLGEDEDLNDSNSPFYSDIEISSTGIFYAYLSEFTSSGYLNVGGVFRSENGIDWAKVTPPNIPDLTNRAVLAIAPSNENILYMVISHGMDDTNSMWKYTFQGGSASSPVGIWDDLSENIPAFGGDYGDYDPQGSYNMALAVQPDNEDIIFLGGTNLYRSDDGFRTSDNLMWIGGYDTLNDGSQFENHHADQHEMFFALNGQNRLYSAHDGGVSFTDQSTEPYPVWESINQGYITSQFYSVAIQPDEANNLIAGGVLDNGSWFGNLTDAGDWTRILGGDGTYAAISARNGFWYVSSQEAKIFRFQLDFPKGEISSASRIDPVGAGEKNGQEYLFVNPYVLDPNDDDRMFLAGGDAVWRNQNLSQIPSGTREKVREGWERMENTSLNSGTISTLISSASPANILYYGTSDGRLFRIDNAHIGDGQIKEITPNDFQGFMVNINVDPLDSDHLIVIFSNYNIPSIFLSTNGGQSFEDIGGNLEENSDGTGNGPSIRWGEIVPLNGGAYRYYVGTSTGAYSTDNPQGAQTIWEREGSATLGQSVVRMLRYRPLDGRLVAATHGSGVFASAVDNFLKIDPVIPRAEKFEVKKPYPNPFYENVTIEFETPDEDIVLVRVIDMSGKWIRTPLWGTQGPGTNHVTWDGKDVFGQPVDEGIYVMAFSYQGNVVGRKVILNR